MRNLSLEFINAKRFIASLEKNEANTNEVQAAQNWLHENKVDIETYLSKLAANEYAEAVKQGVKDISKQMKFFNVVWRNLNNNEELQKYLSVNGLLVSEIVKNVKFHNNQFDLMGILSVNEALQMFKNNGSVTPEKLLQLVVKFDKLTDEQKLTISQRGDKVLNLLKQNRESGLTLTIYDAIVSVLQFDITRPKDKRKAYIFNKDAAKLVLDLAPKRYSDKQGQILDKFPALEGLDLYSGLELFLFEKYGIKYAEFIQLIGRKDANGKTLNELIEARETDRKKVINEQGQKSKTTTTKKNQLAKVA